MYTLVFTKTYERAEKKFLGKHPELVERYKKILELLELNPTHPSLKLHDLGGKLEGRFAVHITHSYRLTLSFAKREKKDEPKTKAKNSRKNEVKTEDEIPTEIILLYVGSYDEVYR
jgi:mRNA-degrading endonuclease YafQ of YafQ-DinJ toxin-antitoxin module